MKVFNYLKYLTLSGIIILSVSGCDDLITDFGNDAAISGKIVDQSGNIVAGDITTTNLSVKALGEGDVTTTDLRVSGAGIFQNTKLYPKKYKIWVTGPVSMQEDTLSIDFGSNRTVAHDFVVIPFLTVKPPVVVGSPSSTSITITYEIIGNGGKSPNLREMYCSTNPYPNASTGSGPAFETKKVALTANSGTASVTGLTSGKKYYIRIGARAAGQSGFNYSDQIGINTP